MKANTNATAQDGASPAQQLEGFIDKFDSKNAALIRSVRKALRKRLPTANEFGLRQLQLLCYRVQSN